MKSLLLAVAFHSFVAASGPPENIYVGRAALWSAYLDDRKSTMIVEVSGVKYGDLDTLTRVENSAEGLVASSRKGELYLKNGVYSYCNRELKFSVKLKRQKYTDRMDAQRQKLYGVHAVQVIHALKQRYNHPDYQISGSFREDYLYFRDHTDFPMEYKPGFISDFFRKMDIQ